MTGKSKGWRRAASVLWAAAALAGCDAGDPQTVRTGGTGAPKSVTSGAIEGLGSVVVNGIRFDDTGARVTINGADGYDTLIVMAMLDREYHARVALGLEN